jgi:DNA-binding transcriptional ArsR family regulator
MRMRAYKTSMRELDPVFDTVAGYFGVLAEPTRLRIMHALCLGERSVTQIVAQTGASQTNVSRHLGLMHRHGMVARRKDGTAVIYRVADPTMIELCREVCNRIAITIDERQPARRHFQKFLPSPRKRVAA